MIKRFIDKLLGKSPTAGKGRPPQFGKREELGVEARGLSPEEFDVYLKSEYKRWGGVIQKAGISLDK